MGENKIQKVRRTGRLTKLIKDLNSKNAIEKEEREVIITWINSAYEIGLRDAGDIIGVNISKAIDEELKKKAGECRE